MEELKSEVMCSLVPVMQEDQGPVPRESERTLAFLSPEVQMALLNFIENMSSCDTLPLTQGNVIIPSVIELGTMDPSNEEDICLKCLQILHMLLDTWLDSPKDNERERAMWCTAQILGFVTGMNNFEVDIHFPQLGRLVKQLTIGCQDPVENIRFYSSQAMSGLYRILRQQNEMERQKRGLWRERGKNEFYSAMVFRNSTHKIAKAFTEYLTHIEVTDLVLTAMEDLTHSKAKVSLAAAQLMNGILKTRGRDILKLEEVVQGLLGRLALPLEPSTEEETLQAMGWLAGSHPNTVVPMLLSKPLPWDRTMLSLWKAFGSQHNTITNILPLIMGILENDHPGRETEEMASQPMMVALYEMLSGSPCREAVQELYPQLLLAVLNYLFWVTEQASPHNVVVSPRAREPGSKSKPSDHTSCALDLLRLLVGLEQYHEEDHHCWDLLSSPYLFHQGLIELTSGLVRQMKPAKLHRILVVVENLLGTGKNGQKVVARIIYSQLLWEPSVAQVVGHHAVASLVMWIQEPSRMMKEIGLLGLTNLALHPEHSEAVKSLVPLLGELLKSKARVAVQALKCLWNIAYRMEGEEVKQVFGIICKQLRCLINHGRYQVRINAVTTLALLLHQMLEIEPGESTQEEVSSFLLPLLLCVQEYNVEVVKASGWALTEWSKLMGWTSVIEIVQDLTLHNHLHIVEETCKVLLSTGRLQLVGDLLMETFGFLKTPIAFLREAAVQVMGFIVKNIHMDDICKADVQLIRDVLQDVMMSDPVPILRSTARDILEDMNESVKSHHFLMSRLRQMRKMLRKKKCLFQTLERKGTTPKNTCDCFPCFRFNLRQQNNT